MKLGLATALVHRRKRKKNRTHTAPVDGKPLARQMRKLRRYYDRLARVAARLEGRPQPQPGMSLKLKIAATMMQTGMSRRETVVHLLRERAAKLGEPPP